MHRLLDACVRPARDANGERESRHLAVKCPPMSLETVVTELLAVVRDEHHDRLLVLSEVAQCRQELSDMDVRERDLAVVPVDPLGSELLGDARVHPIVVVWVEVVGPQEPRTGAPLGAQPRVRPLVDAG